MSLTGFFHLHRLYGFRAFFERFLSSHSNGEIKRLMSSVAILNLAISAISLFEPIYLYTLGFPLWQILLFYAVVHLLYAFLMPFGAQLVARWGLHHAILASSPFLIVFFMLLIGTAHHRWLIVPAALVYAVQKALYWVGYHIEMAHFGNANEGGKEVSNMIALISLVRAAGPVAGGVLIAAFGFEALFIVAAVLILVSNLPLISAPEVHEEGRFDLRGVYRRVFLPDGDRKVDRATLGFGEAILGMVVWPVFIFIALDGFAATGLLVTLAMSAAILFTLYAGRVSDRHNREAVVRVGSLGLVGSWIARIFLASPIMIGVIDAFHRVSFSMMLVPLRALQYAEARRSNVLDAIATQEMLTGLAIASAGLLAAVLAFIMPGEFTPLFVLAALLSFLYARVR